MKWLFILLVAVNVILFVIQIKEKDEFGSVSHFKKVAGSKEIKLLKGGGGNLKDRCVVVGAISDASVLSDVTNYLSGRAVVFDLIEKESVLAPSYWVYVVDEVKDIKVESLEDLGVESYLIASGELKGKLSVGLFANIDLAKGMISSLGKSGINADFIEKRNVKKAKWLSFSLDEVRDGDHIVNALKGMEINLGEIKEFFCKSIASEK